MTPVHRTTDPNITLIETPQFRLTVVGYLAILGVAFFVVVWIPDAPQRILAWLTGEHATTTVTTTTNNNCFSCIQIESFNTLPAAEDVPTPPGNSRNDKLDSPAPAQSPEPVPKNRPDHASPTKETKRVAPSMQEKRGDGRADTDTSKRTRDGGMLPALPVPQDSKPLLRAKKPKRVAKREEDWDPIIRRPRPRLWDPWAGNWGDEEDDETKVLGFRMFAPDEPMPFIWGPPLAPDTAPIGTTSECIIRRQLGGCF